MRIVVLGDFHIHPKEHRLTEEAIEHINSCKPDLVVPLGDFGCHSTIGGVEGLEQGYQFLSELKSQIRPILGNHDLQRETGPGKQLKGTVARKLVELYQVDAENGVLEYDHFRLFFVGTDPQPQDSCYQIQECYVTDEHFAWIEAKLKERPEVPCIFFTHAPPVGAALRTVPLVHVRATNAYLDQNHNFYRWPQLIQDYPSIKMWFSAHYHLGHDFEDSSTYRNSVTFFHTGVHSSYTRDGKRHSRVIDIDDGAIRVSTLDHETGDVRTQPDWSSNFKNWSRDDSRSGRNSVEQVRGEISCGIGQRDTIVTELVPMNENCLLAVTSDGFMWEVDYKLEAVFGTHHIGDPIYSVVSAEDGLWKAWGKYLKKSDPHDLYRFVRELSELSDTEIGEVVLLPEEITALAQRHGGGVWAACGRNLFEIIGSTYSLVQVFTEAIIQIISEDGNLYLLNERGHLMKSEGTIYETGVKAWDRYQGEEIVIQEENSWILTDGKVRSIEWQTPDGDSHDLKPMQAVCLGEERFLLLSAGRVFAWSRGTGWIAQKPGRLATAISRVIGLSSLHFAVALEATEEDPRSQVQIWEISFQ
jgi:predicted phosphodiesterase